MKLRKHFELTNVLKYVCLTLAFTIFACLKKPASMYATALLSVCFLFGFNKIISIILFLISLVFVGRSDLLLSGAIASVFLLIVSLVYKIKDKKIRAEICIYTLISLLGYVILDDGMIFTFSIEKILESVFTSLLSLIVYVGMLALTKKGLKFKLGNEEFACIFISISLVGLGLSNLISPYLWKGVSILILLIVCYVYKMGVGTLISVVLGSGLAVYYGNINYISLYLLFAVSAQSLTVFSRYAEAFFIIVVDYGAHALFGVYGAYGFWESVSTISAVIVFCFIPNKTLNTLKEKISLFKEKQLIRQTINRNRIMTANKLYDLSGVFREISDSFTLFSENTVNDKKIKNAIEKEINISICSSCSNYTVCQGKGIPKKNDAHKMLEIGIAKGKLSFIDIPSELSQKCIHVSELIYAVNKLIAQSKTTTMGQMQINAGREILKSGAKGVSEILSGLAFECGSVLKYQNRLEKELNDNLYKSGFSVSELLCYGDEKDLTIGLVLSMKEFSTRSLLRVIAMTVGFDMCLIDKTRITDDKCYLSFKKSAEYDAIFGISSAKKDGSDISGDTHALSRIGDDKFLVALSDGMGSGETAQTVSSASLSLIECFYKAGLPTPLILTTVNKLLAISTDDVFTALDVSVIDLKNCTADFIKYGAPYGFIISQDSVRIVEGSSLPLGILEDLKPAVCQTTLVDGDIVLLVTDGITDSFGSASDVIEFLRTLPALNPQTLTDCLLKKTLDLSNGQKNDDMTALAVRIFKRESMLEA